jgi:peptidyl-prolyl cis-trans isomerase B (cyclophilin B)
MKLKRLISFLLAAVITSLSLISLTSCSKDKCAYASERDITGRDIHYVEISVKDYGKIVVLLDGTTAPVTVANFLKLVGAGFYDGLTFHRIIKDFMIQGGDPKGDGTGGSAETIFGEFSSNGHKNDISHIRGVISMARSRSNNSASSQFFICNADASESLDGNYAAFGYVVEGMSVVDKITEKVFPKTAYADYYGNSAIDPTYGVSKHTVWSHFGNGTVEKDSDKPVIEYIKVLSDYSIGK